MGGIDAVSGGGYGYTPVSNSDGPEELGGNDISIGGGDDGSSNLGLSGDSFEGGGSGNTAAALGENTSLQGISLPQCGPDFLDSLIEPEKAPAQKAPEPPADRTYTVGKGDNLSKIAQKEYKDPDRWTEIYAANKDVIGDKPNNLQVGTELTIPANGVAMAASDKNALYDAAHIEPPAASPSESPAAEVAAPAAKLDLGATMAASQKGDAAAVTQNLQNIVDATQDRFKSDFVAQYQADNGGKAPSEAKVNEAYYDQLMKGFTNARYPSFNDTKVTVAGMSVPVPLAGFRPSDVNPIFKDPEVMKMYNSFPNSYAPPDGGAPVSVNHLLSGIQFETTHSEGLGEAALKNSVGVGINSPFAELNLKDEKSQEKGLGGINAAQSPTLQAAFKQDPVKALGSFLASPSRYAAEGQGTSQINPFKGYAMLANEAAKLFK